MSTGGNLFGTRVTWLRIIAIAVIFVAWSNIMSCNAENEAKSEDERIGRLATSASAIDYCKTNLRKDESFRERFEITNTTSTLMGTNSYRVVLTTFTGRGNEADGRKH